MSVSSSQTSFDVVLAFNLLHLLDGTPAAIRRIRELLKPGGLFISKTVCLGEKGRLLRCLVFIMRKLGLAPYVKSLKIQELEDFITDQDFQIIETGVFPASPPSRFIVAKKL
jgi:SAM-dependent methyltransferase